MTYSPTTWINGTTPLDSTNMTNIENGIVNAVCTTGPTSTDSIGYGLNGSNDVGIMAKAHVAVVGGAVETILKTNNYNDGTDDRYISGSFGALQLRISTTGIAARVNTGSPTTGGVISWGSDTFLYGS